MSLYRNILRDTSKDAAAAAIRPRSLSDIIGAVDVEAAVGRSGVPECNLRDTNLLSAPSICIIYTAECAKEVTKSFLREFAVSVSLSLSATKCARQREKCELEFTKMWKISTRPSRCRKMCAALTHLEVRGKNSNKVVAKNIA
jgi:hypothetical protein